MSDWLWHLFHDPMNRNPWAAVALVVVLVTAGIAVCVGPVWWHGRRR